MQCGHERAAQLLKHCLKGHDAVWLARRVMNHFDSGMRDAKAIATHAVAKMHKSQARNAKERPTIAARPMLMARHTYVSIHQTEIANAKTTISAELFSTDWIMYALAAIAIIVTVLLFFIVWHRMR
jgi:DNA repair protein RadC